MCYFVSSPSHLYVFARVWLNIWRYWLFSSIKRYTLWLDIAVHKYSSSVRLKSRPRKHMWICTCYGKDKIQLLLHLFAERDLSRRRPYFITWGVSSTPALSSACAIPIFRQRGSTPNLIESNLRLNWYQPCQFLETSSLRSNYLLRKFKLASKWSFTKVKLVPLIWSLHG